MVIKHSTYQCLRDKNQSILELSIQVEKDEIFIREYNFSKTNVDRSLYKTCELRMINTEWEL